MLNESKYLVFLIADLFLIQIDKNNTFLLPRSIKSFFLTPCFSASRQGKNISHQEILCNRGNCTWNLSSNLPRNTQLRFSGNKRFIPWPQLRIPVKYSGPKRNSYDRDGRGSGAEILLASISTWHVLKCLSIILTKVGGL